MRLSNFPGLSVGLSARRSAMAFCAVVLAALLLGACGGGSNTPTLDRTASAGGASTGNVAILLTDAPSDAFSEVNITITRIELLGEGGSRVEVFNGERTIDLLSLRDNSDLFSIADVPAGDYEKIRLTVTNVTLVKRDEQGTVIETITPRLPGGGRIDLNPRDPFRVAADATLVLEIDIDAEKSIHVSKQGNGDYLFRPVVFINVVSDTAVSKLIKIRGTVARLDLEDRRFVLCNLDRGQIHDRAGDHQRDHDTEDAEDENRTLSTQGRHDDNDAQERRRHDLSDDDDDGREEVDDILHEPHERSCIIVKVTEETALYSPDGPISIEDLVIDERVNVLGRIDLAFHDSRADDTLKSIQEADHPVSGKHLILEAVIVMAGNLHDYAWASGTAASAYDPDSGTFELRMAAGTGLDADTVVTVRVDEDTRLFGRAGDPLTPEEIEAGDKVRLVGRLDTTEETTPLLQAFIVFVSDPHAATVRLRGIISGTSPATPGFTLITAEGDRCVRIANDASLFRITLLNGGFESEQITRFALEDGQRADVYGRMSSEGCLVADNILVGVIPDEPS